MVRFIFKIISRNLSQNGTFRHEIFVITTPMAGEPETGEQRIIKRTVTITTVETWTITIEGDPAPVSIEPEAGTEIVSETSNDEV